MTNEEIQQIFFQECDEGLASAETGLMACRAGDHDGETINTIFRAVHSIKGGAGAFGFVALQSFTHHFETVLDQVRGGDLPLEPGLMTILLRAFDVLADHVAAIRGRGCAPDDRDVLEQLKAVGSGEQPAAPASIPEPQRADLSFDLDALLGGLDLGVVDVAADAVPAALPWRVRVEPGRGALHNGGEPLLLLRELIALGGEIVTTEVDHIPGIDDFQADGAYLAWSLSVPGTVDRAAIEEIFEFVAGDCRLDIARGDAAFATEVVVETSPNAAAPAPNIVLILPEMAMVTSPKNATPPAAQTIRVDLDKLDRLVNLVGELVITQALLTQRLHGCGQSAIQELSDLDHLTRELQDSAMAIRAQPVKSVFSRLPRIVRELEAQTGKRIRLDVEGEATELDKTVIERIGEPLTHLIRNSVDHGIESPADRIAAGKHPEGVVRLAAEHRGGRIIISVEDDGKGIDRERVHALAVERGIIAADARLTDEEIDNLIFAPGFSTAKVVSNISGRGVGMDVVRRNVQALGGRITINSRPGHGATFTLALPLTLAILDGMIVSVGAETYVIPLTHIIESLRPAPGAVKPLGRDRHMLDVRGTYLPVQSVAQKLGIDGGVTNPAEAVLIVVETEDRGQAVLMVDTILDQRQVVIKSLETNYRPVDGCAGATILGDGRVALIIDVESLVALDADAPPMLMRA